MKQDQNNRGNMPQNDQDLWSLLNTEPMDGPGVETSEPVSQPVYTAAPPQFAESQPKGRVDGLFLACMAGVAVVSVAATLLISGLFGGKEPSPTQTQPVESTTPAIVLELESKNAALTNENAALELENAELLKQVEEQRKQIEALEEDLKELTDSTESQPTDPSAASESTDPSEPEETTLPSEPEETTKAPDAQADADVDKKPDEPDRKADND